MKERQLIVLIADGELESRAALRDDLSRDSAARYVVIEADSGVRALELCRARKPDCLILDHDLRDLSGLDALKELTPEAGSPACAVVVLVDAGDAQLAVEAMKSGAHGCLEKGRAKGAELRHAVIQAIEKAEQRRRGEARERELIEKNRALEADLAVLRREEAGRERGAEVWQVARAGAGSQRAVVSQPEKVFQNQTEEQLRLLKKAVEQSAERKQIEEALRTSEAQLRAILDHSVAMIFVKDLEGRYLRVNRSYEESFGVTDAELKGKTDYDHHPKEIADAFVANDREVITSNRPILFEEQALVAGETRYSVVSKFPLRDGSGRPYAVCGIATDITERKRAETTLREGQARFRAIFENAAVGIARVTPDGRWLEVNQRLCDIVGYASEELLTKTFSEITHPDDLEQDLRVTRRLLAGEIETYLREKRYYRKDGSVVWVNLTVSLMRRADGSPDYFIAITEDISAHKWAEESLMLSDERLSIAIQTGDIGISDWDIRADSLVWSEKYVNIYGLPPGKTSGKYEDWRGRVYHEDLPAVEDLIWGTFKKKLSNWQAKYRIVRADNGEVRWIESRHQVFYDANGAPLRTVGSALDVTDRILAEEAIRESESRLRQLADAMPQIVYTSSPDGMVDYGNQRWVDYVGVPVEQSIGLKWIEAIHPDDREITMRRFNESGRTGQPFEVEYRLRRNDGRYRWYLARATAIHNEQGRIVKWIGTATDIHDRKQAEAEREELLAREQASRAEAEHSAESILRLQALTDSAIGRLTLDNLLREMLARIRELLETDSATILLLTEDGQELSVRATIGWEETATGLRVPFGQDVAGSIAASRAPLVVEDLRTWDVLNPVLRRNSRSLIGAPLIVEGRLIGVIHADTAQVRRFTKDDVRLLQLAADRVALTIEHARIYEVERQARRQAEEANRVKDEFLALVSHELRSPLNAILGYAALLRYGRLDAQNVKHAADVIERSGKAQTQLIDDLLDTARIISGKLRLELGPVDLVSVIEQAVETIHPAADAKEISLETDLPAEIGQITGDPARLQQVVWNLLSNAVKFTSQGGRVKARLERVDPYICITVSDTGKGISPDFLPYVFDRFRQADASSARRYGGLGLGLSLVKYLVELHGGTIEAASAGEGQGATFKVTLPVRAVATPLVEAGGAPATTKISEALAGVRALVVDDEDDARELIETALTQYGADVVAVGSAAEAYGLITASPTQWRPDVVVTDIAMPGEDGYSLIRRVREWERARGAYIPAVALTAYGRTEDRVRALSAGFQMHVAKPVDPDELSIVITSLIRRPSSDEKR